MATPSRIPSSLSPSSSSSSSSSRPLLAVAVVVVVAARPDAVLPLPPVQRARLCPGRRHRPADLLHQRPLPASQSHLQCPLRPPGGGAEALPAGLYPPSSSLSWFSHSDPFNSPLHSSLPRHSFPPPNPAYHHPSSSASPQSAASTYPPSPVSPVYPNSPSAATHPPFLPHLPLSIPPTAGLPIYSASGFDLIALLTRVHTRPFPKIYLGPVDLSCSFVVTDARRFDSPIVYASPSFLKLTGYEEREVLGHNCRFLQSPGGRLDRGDDRLHTSTDAVAYMRKNILADKECQVNLVNYRKDGSAFINMVSVIPLKGGANNSPDEADDVVYHIGFQVDLTEQPKSILSKLKDGSYVVNYSDKPFPVPPPSSRDWRSSSLAMRGTSKDLRSLLSDPAFIASFHLSTTTHASTAIALSTNPPEPFTPDPFDGNKPLHMFLLNSSPDFLLVVSLKGAFLYVAPAVRRVLGYNPDDLLNKSLSDFCHPADCVPLMRELKEASITPGPSLLTSNTPSPSTAPMTTVTHGPNLEASPASIPRSVVSYCRILDSSRSYVWIELRGKLHVEPGKGRKAIILSCRLRNMPHLEWGPISRAGGLVPPLPRSRLPSGPSSLTSLRDLDQEVDERPLEREFWGLLSTHATFLYVGAAVRDVLAWGAGEVIGKPLADFVCGASSRHDVQAAIEAELAKVLTGAESSGLVCNVQTKDAATVSVHIVFYRSRPPASPPTQPGGGGGGGGGDEPPNRRHPAAQPPIACQIKLADGVTSQASASLIHPLDKSVFEEAGIDRSSSWQYELQQVKFCNQRLAEEIAALEAGNAKKLRRKQTSSSSASMSSAALPGGASASSRPSTGTRMA
ncbi:PAS domain-containing protein, partial [Daedaleopsis nitida]